jgi:DnaK suppressor protein
MSDVTLAEYRPCEDEPYMSRNQLAYFRDKLMLWRDDILRGSDRTLRQLKEEDTRLPDISDWASAEIQRSFQLRTRDRERKLLAKIDEALQRIDETTYGYCEETQEPIGIKRLDARPVATLSIEAQERHERREKVYRND